MNISLIVAGGVMAIGGAVVLIQDMRANRVGFPLLTGGFVLIIVGFLGGCTCP